MTEYTGPERRGNGGWHLSKSLSLSHLVATFGIVIAGFTYVSDLEKDILSNGMDVQNLKETVQRHQDWNGKAFDEIKNMLSSISDRLNELADRRRN